MAAQFRVFLPNTMICFVCLLFYLLLYGSLSKYGYTGFHSMSEERNWSTWLKSFHYAPKMDLNENINKTALLNNFTVITIKEKSMSATTDPMTIKRSVKHKKGATGEPRIERKETPMFPLEKKNFRQYPNWTFEDVYLRDKQPRHTICPHSLVNSDDPDFKKAFIPDIKMYFHRKLLNLQEWNRLAHFNNPFGFMEFPNYTEIKAVVDRIPEPTEPLLQPQGNPGCIRCAVVGTGGILNGSMMGKEIDAHEYVFRVNGAVTKGYEEDVGNRTSVYVHTAHAIRWSPIRFQKYGYTEAPHNENIKYVMIPEGLRDFRWLQGLYEKTRVAKGEYRNTQPWLYYSGQFDVNRFYVLHPDFLRYIRKRFMWSRTLKTLQWPLFRPTNGAFTLFLALHTCDEVDAYGFITEDHSKYPNYYFERQSKTRVIFYSNHDYNLEIQTWKKLHDTKIIKLYQRKEDP